MAVVFTSTSQEIWLRSLLMEGACSNNKANPGSTLALPVPNQDQRMWVELTVGYSPGWGRSHQRQIRVESI